MVSCHIGNACCHQRVAVNVMVRREASVPTAKSLTMWSLKPAKQFALVHFMSHVNDDHEHDKDFDFSQGELGGRGASHQQFQSTFACTF
jgi:hypothetical protein